jgi:gamma-glutamyltranspeptidase/glutathione hydrolase
MAPARASPSTIAAPASTSNLASELLAGGSGRCIAIIPAFMRKGVFQSDSALWAAGTSRRRTQFVANVVDFGMNVQMALEAARFTGNLRRLRRQMETRVANAVRQELADAATYRAARRFPPRWGTAGGDTRRRRGVNFAGSDPRTDGAAIPNSRAPSERAAVGLRSRPSDRRQGLCGA